MLAGAARSRTCIKAVADAGYPEAERALAGIFQGASLHMHGACLPTDTHGTRWPSALGGPTPHAAGSAARHIISSPHMRAHTSARAHTQQA